jgi:phage shock protein PspC (stress-responsive transcriptional regulator)
MLDLNLDLLANVSLLVLVMWAIDAIHRGRAEPLYMQVPGRWISGTCAGIARTLELPVWLVRSGFLIALLVGAHAILAYLCLELVMRWDPAQRHLLWSNRLWASLKR